MYWFYLTRIGDAAARGRVLLRDTAVAVRLVVTIMIMTMTGVIVIVLRRTIGGGVRRVEIIVTAIADIVLEFQGKAWVQERDLL